MNCQDVLNFLAAYLAGELPWWRRWLFKVHLTFCAPCRRYLASYRETLRLCKESALPVILPPPLPEELVHAVLAMIPPEKSRAVLCSQNT
jgi:anti-sigma factor RsiW